jgi:hypothetical protein
MKYIKLFENFNNEVKYFVNKVGDSYRIFALTPKMMADGNKEPQDAEDLFDQGSFWTDYPTYQDAQDVIDSLNSDEEDISDEDNIPQDY